MIGSIYVVVSLGLLVVFWNTGRHIVQRVTVSDDALSVAPYFGTPRRIRWDEITTIRDFTILGWTARRHTVMLEGAGTDWVAFFHDIDRFDELRAIVGERARFAVARGAPPWWTRLLRLGTV